MIGQLTPQNAETEEIYWYYKNYLLFIVYQGDMYTVQCLQFQLYYYCESVLYLDVMPVLDMEDTPV